MALKSHWDMVYQMNPADGLSWFCPHLNHSLALVTRAAPGKGDSTIDVGGGSTLVDDLLALGYGALTVLDISDASLALTRQRLGNLEARVTWQVADITTAMLPEAHYEIWHDRAVFHFLTLAGDRAAYVARVKKSLKPGGHLIIATFGPNGPLMCSDLDVVRYDHEALQQEFGSDFTLLAHEEIDHVSVQM